MFYILQYVGLNENYIILELLPYKGMPSQYKRDVRKGPCHFINYILILIFYNMPRCYIINIIFNLKWSYSMLVNGCVVDLIK
jgi:hypothetical protein